MSVKSDSILMPAYEIIAREILRAGNEGVLIDRDTIANKLLGSHLKSKILERSKQPGRDTGNPHAVAANWVDWFSAHITMGANKTEKWNNLFQRARVLKTPPNSNLVRPREIWAYTTRDYQNQGQLLMRIEPDGQIHIGIIGDDGRWTLADGTQLLPCGIYTVNFGRWADLIKELEILINDPNCTERMLQKFFETNPKLLMGHNYQSVIPEAVIQRDNVKTRKESWRADFILSPIDQEEFCKILELKRPQLKSARNPKRGHPRFYKELHEAIQQLRDYHDAFQSFATRERFKNRYQVDVFRPDLQLIIGRKWDKSKKEPMLRMQKDNFIQIRSWDSELERLRREFT